MSRAGMVLTVFALAACDSGTGARVPEGPWGGEHVALMVHATGAAVLLDCAHGEITVPLRVEPDGQFSLPGYYVRDVGPVMVPENRQPATYFGSFDGRKITVSFTLIEAGLTEGPFVALPGGQADVQRCREAAYTEKARRDGVGMSVPSDGVFLAWTARPSCPRRSAPRLRGGAPSGPWR